MALRISLDKNTNVVLAGLSGNLKHDNINVDTNEQESWTLDSRLIFKCGTIPT